MASYQSHGVKQNKARTQMSITVNMQTLDIVGVQLLSRWLLPAMLDLSQKCFRFTEISAINFGKCNITTLEQMAGKLKTLWFSFNKLLRIQNIICSILDLSYSLSLYYETATSTTSLFFSFIKPHWKPASQNTHCGPTRLFLNTSAEKENAVLAFEFIL